MQRSTNTMVEYSPGANVDYTPGQMAAGATAGVAVVVAAMVAAAFPVATVAAAAGAVTAVVVRRVRDRGPGARASRPPDDGGAGTNPVGAE